MEEGIVEVVDYRLAGTEDQFLEPRREVRKHFSIDPNKVAVDTGSDLPKAADVGPADLGSRVRLTRSKGSDILVVQ
jgi:hypothetical protein